MKLDKVYLRLHTKITKSLCVLCVNSSGKKLPFQQIKRQLYFGEA